MKNKEKRIKIFTGAFLVYYSLFSILYSFFFSEEG
jgi:hypothetical protein